MGCQGHLGAIVVVQIYNMRAANQPVVRVSSPVHTSVTEILDVTLEEKQIVFINFLILENAREEDLIKGIQCLNIMGH